MTPVTELYFWSIWQAWIFGFYRCVCKRLYCYHSSHQCLYNHWTRTDCTAIASKPLIFISILFAFNSMYSAFSCTLEATATLPHAYYVRKIKFENPLLQQVKKRASLRMCAYGAKTDPWTRQKICMLSRPWYIVLKSEKNGGSNRHSLKMFTEAHEFDQTIPSQNAVL